MTDEVAARFSSPTARPDDITVALTAKLERLVAGLNIEYCGLVEKGPCSSSLIHGGISSKEGGADLIQSYRTKHRAGTTYY